jgi:hypothetical protein
LRRRIFLSEFTPQRTPFSLISTLRSRISCRCDWAQEESVQNEDQQHLYSPPLGHPRDPPLGHPPRPRPKSRTHRALRRATPTLRRPPVHPPSSTCPPPSGARPPSVGHPSGCPSALLAHWVSRGTLVAPSGFSVGLLRQAQCSTICINILAYHDYVYIIILWRSTWPKVLNI